MITFGVNFPNAAAMKSFIHNRKSILENVGIANDHVISVGEHFPWLEAKCKEALGVRADKGLTANAYFGKESNCYWCTYHNTDPSTGVLWRYGVVFDVEDENKAIMLKLALS